VLPVVPGGGGALIRAAAHADEAAGALHAMAHADEAAGAAQAAARGTIAEEIAQQLPRGGTYKLIDQRTGEVRYVGRTRDLARREAEHARDPDKAGLYCEVDWRTDDYRVMRGREQMLYEQYQPDKNRLRPISPRNPHRSQYLEAARQFEASRGQE